jgi:hypothetical protein
MLLCGIASGGAQEVPATVSAAEKNRALILGFIEKSVLAASGSSFADDAEGAKKLGIQWEDVHIGVGQPWQGVERRITTGIGVLDRNPSSVKYHVLNRPDFLWGISVSQVPACLVPADIESRYGKADRVYAPANHDRQGRGVFEYDRETGYGRYVARFEYRQPDKAQNCLYDFALHARAR